MSIDLKAVSQDGRLRYVYCHQGVWMVDANTFAPGGAVDHSEVMFLGAGIHHFSDPGPQGWVHEVKGA